MTLKIVIALILLYFTEFDSVAGILLLIVIAVVHYGRLQLLYTVFQKKTSTHIIGYKLRNSCPILIIFDIKIPHII